MGDRKENQEFERLARDIVARGRAAGVIFLAATQRPSHDIVPTSLRDLFAFRWALRCTTPQASDTILGQGWASQGFSASDIDAGTRGVGYLRQEGDVPVRMRSFCLTDDDIDILAKRAADLRKSPPQAA
jgi:DNA segregation ATPase FtsK/SpoIIIE, S-DNA-T family